MTSRLVRLDDHAAHLAYGNDPPQTDSLIANCRASSGSFCRVVLAANCPCDGSSYSAKRDALGRVSRKLKRSVVVSSSCFKFICMMLRMLYDAGCYSSLSVDVDVKVINKVDR